MSVVSLNSNIASLKAIRKLSDASSELSSTFERLSSGQRINRAADDAAGLAVSSTLNAKAKVYTQAVRNLNDGISYLNIADGATHELKNILFRLRELSTQSSSGTYTDTQRQALDTEAQAMQGEYNRILSTTQFNGQAIFTGNSALTVQAGYGQSGTLMANLAASGSSISVGDGTFQGRQSFVTGPNPNGVAIGDFNGDGRADLVTADRAGGTGNTLSVLLGNGDGTFQAGRSFLVGTEPRYASSADFNGDGKQDLVSADYSSNTLSVLLGNGDGTFQARRSFTTGTGPLAIAIGDFNGDGKADLVATDSAAGAGTLSVLLGNGNGTFQARQSFVTGTGPAFVVVQDLNGDGKIDLVATDRGMGAGTTLSVLLGNGNGTFQARQSFVTGTGPDGVAIGDFNGDGKADIVVSDFAGGAGTTLSVLLGNGNGTFQARHSFVTGTGPAFVVVQDLNGDGKIDLVAADRTANTVSVLLGNGNGSFQGRQSFVTGTNPNGVAIGDFNGDGVADLSSVDSGSNSISILLGNPRRGLLYITGISIGTQAASLTAQGQIDSYLDNVNTVSGIIGASMSRFQTAARMVATTSDVFRAAEGRIIDADVAADSAILVKNNILQQAASAVLAQANQEPALALMLLGDRSK